MILSILIASEDHKLYLLTLFLNRLITCRQDDAHATYIDRTGKKKALPPFINAAV